MCIVYVTEQVQILRILQSIHYDSQSHFLGDCNFYREIIDKFNLTNLQRETERKYNVFQFSVKSLILFSEFDLTNIQYSKKKNRLAEFSVKS